MAIAKATTGPEGGQTQTCGSCHCRARSLCRALAGDLGPSASCSLRRAGLPGESCLERLGFYGAPVGHGDPGDLGDHLLRLGRRDREQELGLQLRGPETCSSFRGDL